MTTTYTPTLQLSLQGTGDNNNTWGTVANLVFAQVDQAVNGYLSLSVAGNSNVTLTWPTGTNVSNQANNPTIQFTGALTGNITVFVPAASRRMFYLNATTGAYTLTVAVVGTPGTTVVVPQGMSLPLWTDGTNVYSGMANIGPSSFAGNVTVAGNVGIGTTTPSVKLSVVANTNSNDGLLVSNTSTGASSQAWLNVVAQGWTGVQLIQNQAAGTALVYTADNVSLLFATNATERMRISAAGNVGVGTSNPTQKLNVSGGDFLVQNSTAAYQGIALLTGYSSASVSGNNYIDFRNENNIPTSSIINTQNTDGSNTLNFSSTAAGSRTSDRRSNALTITGSGNVGIGTTTPDINLRVSGTYAQMGMLDGTVDSRLASTSGGGAGIVGTYSNNPMTVYANGAERMRITAAGNVGIGTSNPDSFYGSAVPLAVVKNQNAATIFGIANSTVGASATTQISIVGGTANSYLFQQLVDNNGSPFFANIYGSAVNFEAWNFGGNERMRITAAGNVGIGASSPSSLLTVNGSFYASGVASFVNATTNFGPVSAASGPNLYLINTNGGSGAGASLAFLNNNSSATQKTAAYINGGLVVATAGAEQGLIDFEVFDGTNNVNRIVGMQINPSGASGTFAPNTDNYWNLGLSGYRWSYVYAANGVFTAASATTGFATTSDTSYFTPSGLSAIPNYGIGAPGSNNVALSAFNNLVFYTGQAERMRISSLGNVGIGTSNPDSFYGSAVPLAVVKNQNAATTLGIANGTSGSLAFTQVSLVGGTTNSFANLQLADNSGSPYFQLTTGSTVSGISMIANSNGVKLALNGTSWTSLSDARLKDIIEPITNAASKVSTLRSVIGKFKTEADGVRRSFLLAQDVQAVLPEAVNVAKDAMGTLELSYTDVIPLLVAAINELTARITNLETKAA